MSDETGTRNPDESGDALQTVTFASRIEAPAEDLFAWHEQPGALPRLVPPWMDVKLKSLEGIRDGDRAVLKLGMGPLSLKWVAEHTEYVAGRQFKDLQVKGPFKHWAHTHRMEPEGPDASRLIDHIEYALPFGKLGDLGAATARRQIEQQFAYRHRITQQDLAAHRRYHPGRPLRIAVSGASGLIGSNLVPFLTAGGHEVFRLVRKPSEEAGAIFWNHKTGEVEAEKLEGLDAVVHLAGEPVFALRWSAEKKMRIYGSRVNGTRFLSETLAKLENPPPAFLTASAIGFYGDRGAERLSESAAPAEGAFLSEVTRDWEAATEPATDAGIRTAQMRIGLVLSPQGGALRAMLPAFRLGLGGRPGAPDQYVSWIALDDVLQGVYHLLTNDLAGPFNFTAPEPVTMQTYVRTLAGVLGRPAFFNVPPPLLRLALGEVADETLLASTRVIPEALLQSGYTFLYSDLEAALRHQLGRAPASPFRLPSPSVSYG